MASAAERIAWATISRIVDGTSTYVSLRNLLLDVGSRDYFLNHLCLLSLLLDVNRWFALNIDGVIVAGLLLYSLVWISVKV